MPWPSEQCEFRGLARGSPPKAIATGGSICAIPSEGLRRIAPAALEDVVGLGPRIAQARYASRSCRPGNCGSGLVLTWRTLNRLECIGRDGWAKNCSEDMRLEGGTLGLSVLGRDRSRRSVIRHETDRRRIPRANSRAAQPASPSQDLDVKCRLQAGLVAIEWRKTYAIAQPLRRIRAIGAPPRRTGRRASPAPPCRH